MRLGRKLSEGFAVDREADTAAPTPDTGRADGADVARTVTVTAEPDHVAGTPAVAAGQPPVG